MGVLREWILRFGDLFVKERRDRELADEIESHLGMHTEDNRRAGMTPEEARRQALIRLGGIEQTKEQYRHRRGLPWLETLMQDIRFGLACCGRIPDLPLWFYLLLLLASVQTPRSSVSWIRFS